MRWSCARCYKETEGVKFYDTAVKVVYDADGGMFCDTDDGCGGVCGVCPEAWFCIDPGICMECLPDCVGKQCGPDGCGGSCGSCGANTVCDGAICTDCLPDCEGKQCGEDGCGENCGTCEVDQLCYAQWCRCIPKCAEKTCGDNGCGGVCGICSGGQICSPMSSEPVCRFGDA